MHFFCLPPSSYSLFFGFEIPQMDSLPINLDVSHPPSGVEIDPRCSACAVWPEPGISAILFMARNSKVALSIV